jgi:Spirocyclase AveC-like
MFCLCGASMFWLLNLSDFFQPMFLVSSNFVNLNDPCGHIPFIINTECGRIAHPILAFGLLETFGVLGSSMALGALVARVRRWRPSLTTPQLIGIVMLTTHLVVASEPLMIYLHLWSYTGSPLTINVAGDAWGYPIIPEIFCFGLFLGIPASVRIFKDDMGRTFLERDLSGYSPRTGKLILFMSLYFIFQFTMGFIANMLLWPLGFYQHQWEGVPIYLNTGVCDEPGIITGTRYGPCPGSPGFRMPLRGSIPSSKSP